MTEFFIFVFLLENKSSSRQPLENGRACRTGCISAVAAVRGCHSLAARRGRRPAPVEIRRTSSDR